MRLRAFAGSLVSLGIGLSHVQAAVDAAGQEAAGIVAGTSKEIGVQLGYNQISLHLEARDDAGNLLEEISAGSVSRIIDVAGLEYRISFGKDDTGRPCVIVRPGPAMRKPLFVRVFGRKAVLSLNASLMATLADGQQVVYEPSVCGEVYYIEDFRGTGSKACRLATSRRELAILQKP